MDIIYWIIIGAISGWLAGQFMKGSGFGVVGNILVGIIGGGVGGFLFSLLGLAAGGFIGSIIMSTVGAVALLYVVKMVKSS